MITEEDEVIAPIVIEDEEEVILTSKPRFEADVTDMSIYGRHSQVGGVINNTCVYAAISHIKNCKSVLIHSNASHGGSDDDFWNKEINYGIGGLQNGMKWESDRFKPDHTRHVYTNIRDARISFTNRLHITHEARYRNINIPSFKKFVDGVDRMPNGVYVVDDYIYYGTEIRKAINHYSTSTIKNILDTKVNDIIQKTIAFYNVNNSSNLTIRMLTFIPYEEIQEDSCIYDVNTDLMFSIGQAGISIAKHPYSYAEFKNKFRQNLDSNTHSLTHMLDIIYNNNSPITKWISINGESTAIVSNTSNHALEGIYSSTYKRGGLFREKVSSLEDSHMVGLYNSKEECEKAHNLKLNIELGKQKYEQDKLSFEIKKLEKDNEDLITKINHQKEELEVKRKEIDLAHRKIEAEEEKVKIDNQRRIEDLIIFKEKYKAEKAMLMFKFVNDKKKSNLDLDILKYKFVMEQRKQEIDFKILIMKEEINLIKEIYKSESSSEEMNRAKVRSENIGTVTKTIDLIVKTLSLLK